MTMAQQGQRRMGAQPMFIMSEDASRTSGRDAQSSNITAGKAVAESVRTTLGPRGMDKMLVSDAGDVVITNDGATILGEMDIEHPAAQMIVEVAETQEEEIGDGTTTAAVLAGQLLAQAEELVEDDIHPTTIVEGYHEAARIAEETVDDQVLDEELDDELLRTVAASSMTGKGTGDVGAETLAEHVVEAVQYVADGGASRDDVRVYTRTGSSTSATEVIEGVVLEEEPVIEEMPRNVEDASIAVLDVELDVREAEIDAEYSVDSIDQLNAAVEAEEEELRGYAEALADAGIDVVFATDSIDDRVGSFLTKEGILAFEDLGDDDAKAIAGTSGASRLGSVQDIESDDLGQADRIRVERFGDDDLVFVEGGADAESVTLFVRGGTDHVIDELERGINDAVDVVVAALEAGGVVPGAGSTEIAISDRVRDEASGISGRKQLAVEAFADAVDALPRTLAANAGIDPIDALVDLRATFDAEGRAGIVTEGDGGNVGDPVEAGILDPAAVKREAVRSATESATMIVRIDDVISAE